MAGFEPTTRARNLERLARETFDVLVIGGGITGAGVAREAALRGLDVALVEARDFASGTSSRSSKLIHGGLRYLQQGEVALVREAATERATLRRIAPHLARTLPMLVPVYGRTGAGVYKLRVGLGIYDKLSGVPPEERHRILSREETLAAEPALARERLQGSAVYPEYVTDDARLVLDTLKAAHHGGAAVVNHVRVTGLGADGGVRVATLHDREGDADLAVHARVVINAAGPWVDELRLLDRPGERPTLHLTKGVHLVLRGEDLALRHCVVMTAADGRPVFAVPRGAEVYVGTTDTSYEGPLEEPAVTRDDADYLFQALRRTFEGVALAPEHVVGTWAGLRPLLREEGKRPSEISRRDEIVVSAEGLVTIAGGKLTAYRRMAERVLEAAEPQLGRAPRTASSDRVPLPGGELGDAPDLEAYTAALRARTEGVPAATLGRIATVHGSDAMEVIGAAAGPRELVDLTPTLPLTAAEVRHAVRHEMALTLADVLERRSRLALFATARTAAAAEAVADVVAQELRWTHARRDTEVAAFRRLSDARLSWRDNAPPRG